MTDMKVVVKLKNSEQERVMLAFLDSLEYEYQTAPDTAELTDGGHKDQNTARSWDEIRTELLNLFN
jgi:hypothetical protein